MARILVLGKYVKEGLYTLTREDGTVYKELREGDSIRIGNQMRNWDVIRRGRKMVMVKAGEEYVLPHNRKILWATSSGSARNGLFHFYKELSPLEKALKKWEVSNASIHYVDKIDVTLPDGGLLCHHAGDKRHGFWNWTDSSHEILEYGEVAPDWHMNQYHRGCQEEPDTIRFTDGTFLLHFSLKCSMNGCLVKHLDEVWITPQCDQEDLIRKIREEEQE